MLHSLPNSLPNTTCTLTSGADLGFVKGGANSRLGRGVQSTLPSMQSMLELGGSGGMPPQENFEK